MITGVALALYVVFMGVLATPLNYSSPEYSLMIWILVWSAMSTISFTQIIAFQAPLMRPATTFTTSNSVDAGSLRIIIISYFYKLIFRTL